MNDLTISEINIVPVKPQSGLVAFATCTINKQFYIGNIAIYTSLSSPGGFRLVYPARTLSNGKQLSIVHPISKEAGLLIQKRIVERYLELMEDLTKGGSKNGH